MLGTVSPLSPLAPLAAADPSASTLNSSVIPPIVVLVMCVVAGVGTVMLLPSRRETPLRKIGGAVVLAAALVFAALLVRGASHIAGGAGLSLYFWVFSAVALAGALRVVTHTRPVYSALYFVLTVFATAGLFILLWAEFMAAALVLIYAGAILVTYVFVIMLASSAAPAGGTGAAARPSSEGNGDRDLAADDREAEDLLDDLGDGAMPPAGSSNGESAREQRRAALMGLADYDAVSREPLVASAIGFALMGVLLFVIFDRAASGTAALRPASRDPATGMVVEEGILAAESAPPPLVRAPDQPPRRPPLVAQPPGETQRLGLYLFEHHLVNLELAGLLLTVSMVGAIVIARRRIFVREPVAARGGAAAREMYTAPMTPIDDNPHSIPVYGTDNPRQKAYPEA